jgi:hypothetical protein
MLEANLPGNYTPPVAIGGVGGSGTRLIAQCLSELGFFMGHDLNEANDNLWFTLLFKRAGILTASEEACNELTEIFFKGMTGSDGFTKHQARLIKDLASRDREQHSAKSLKKRARSLLSKKPKLEPDARWGWKEPNSHIVLDRLAKYFRNMKYIHVVRNGLDMAHSRNQNQLELWGRYFIDGEFDTSPYYSLKYWCIIHRRVQEIGKSMGKNFLFLNYDNFCSNPVEGITELCGFLALDSVSIPVDRLSGLVNPPDSVGRFRQHGTEIFDEEDVAYVSELGFDVGESEHGRHA